MRRLRETWNGLFAAGPAGYTEVLLYLLLALAARHGAAAVLRSESAFEAAAAFDPVAVDVQPVGWVSWVPASWVLSHRLDQAVGLVVCASCGCWAAKRLLPWSALTAALSYGTLVSLQQSRLFTYTHQVLPGVALLTLFAAFYTLRRGEVACALRRGAFLSSPLYPRWVGVLVLAYMGSFYTHSALVKLRMSGAEAGSGLTLQLLVGRGEDTPLAAVPVLASRPVATASMTAAVVLEAGALLGLAVPRSRPWWAAGLIGMHTMIWLTMRIPFATNIAILVWIALPGERWFAAAWARLSRRVPVGVAGSHVPGDGPVLRD